MMPKVHLSDAVYQRLENYAKQYARPFVSPNRIVEMLLDAHESVSPSPAHPNATSSSTSNDSASDSAEKDKAGNGQRRGSKVRVLLPGTDINVPQGWADILKYLLRRGATSVPAAISKKECKEKGGLGNAGYGELGELGLSITVDMGEQGSWKRGDGFDAHWAFCLTEKGREVASKL